MASSVRFNRATTLHLTQTEIHPYTMEAWVSMELLVTGLQQLLWRLPGPFDVERDSTKLLSTLLALRTTSALGGIQFDSSKRVGAADIVIKVLVGESFRSLAVVVHVS